MYRGLPISIFTIPNKILVCINAPKFRRTTTNIKTGSKPVRCPKKH